jgi:hypothetical protein
LLEFELGGEQRLVASYHAGTATADATAPTTPGSAARPAGQAST